VKAEGAGPSVITHHLPVGLFGTEYAEYWATFNVVSTIDAMLEIAGVQDFPTSCISATISSDTDLGEAADCLALGGALEAEERAAAAKRAGDAGKAKRLTAVAKGLKSIGKVLAAADFLTSLGFQASGAVGGTKTLTIEYVAPPPPVGTGGGTTAGGGLGLDGLETDGLYLARTADRDGFLVNPSTGIARRVTSGGDFLCYAARRFVVDLVPSFKDAAGIEFLILPTTSGPDRVAVDGDAPACPPIPPLAVWTYTPPPDGNVPRNVILRGPEGGAVTSAWLINSAGEIQTIPDGGVYECLVHANPVIWEVPFEAIQAWTPVGTAPASCG
jgi:hypothetical protein